MLAVRDKAKWCWIQIWALTVVSLGEVQSSFNYWFTPADQISDLHKKNIGQEKNSNIVMV